jgi:hypothetical protein
MGHLTEFIVAVVCYFTLFADGAWQEDCKEIKLEWVSKVVAFNLACEMFFVGFWHWLVYVSSFASGMQPFKFNPKSAYGKIGTGFFANLVTKGHLQREVPHSITQSLSIQSLRRRLRRVR